MNEYMATFDDLYTKFFINKNGVVWDYVIPITEKYLVPYDDMNVVGYDKARELLSKLCVVKLAGGLGTTMGCKYPKFMMKVNESDSFLDIVVGQIKQLQHKYNVKIPLLLMTSFHTHLYAEKLCEQYSGIEIILFKQHCYPRIFYDTHYHLTNKYEGNKCYYPPGHGDIYYVMKESGVLDNMIGRGKQYMFVSNIDNLRATVDTVILKHIVNNNIDFGMEVVTKTDKDVKGGTLIHYNNTIKLLEVAEVPDEHIDEFKSIDKFTVFNTNNIWMNLDKVKQLVDDDMINSEVICNVKVVDGDKIIQLETAMGAAMQFFDNAIGIHVDRSRFMPVKTMEHLKMLIESGEY